MASSYKVNVLFFVNPHQIWVAVQKPEGGIYFEQIGIYGILPMKPNLDVVDGSVKSKRSEAWMPGVVSLMKDLFEDVELYFWPAHVDRVSSIFGDKDIVHKYGELTLINRKGKKYKLSKLLVKSSFAMYNENIFLQELESRNIVTKLSEKEIEQVKAILKQYKSSKKFFSHPYKTVEALTVKSLELHNMNIEQEGTDSTDFYNESDEEPLGRGTRLRNLCRKQKSDLPNEHPQKTKEINNAKFIQLEHSPNSMENKAYMDSTTKSVEEASPPKGPSSLLLKRKLLLTKENPKQDPLQNLFIAKSLLDGSKKDNNTEIKMEKELKPYDANESNYDEDEKETGFVHRDKVAEGVQKNHCYDQFPKVVKKSKKSKKPTNTNKFPEFDVITQACVAYGPDTDLMSLPAKIVPRKQFDQALNVLQIFEGTDKEVPAMKDDYQDEDSDQEVSKPPQRILDAKKNFKGPSVKTSEVDAFKSNRIQIKRSGFTDTQSGLKTATKIDHVKSNIMQNTEILIEGKVQKSDNEIAAIGKPSCQSAYNNVTEKEVHTKIKTNSSGNKSSLLQKNLQIHKKNVLKRGGSSTSTVSDGAYASFEDSSSTSGVVKNKNIKIENIDSDDESTSEILEKINAEYPKLVLKPEKDNPVAQALNFKNHVNPFKNVDPNMSVFVDKLVTPILMVHSKMNKRFEPSFNLRDIHFNSHIQITLKNMNVIQPMTCQTMSWFAILRGYSTFLISPKGSGKTMGYMPAICNLIADNDCAIPSTGPLSIIVCATAVSVVAVERLARLFLNKHKVLACYIGMDELDLTTSLLNGCDLLIVTPSLLVRLLQSSEFGVDLYRLTTFVLDDCERLTEVYGMEIKFYLAKIKEMLRNRTVKELKVQYILASRVWCDFMEPLAKKASDTVVCIGAFQECVLYSKANTTASFLTKEKKTDSVLEFVKQTDKTKRTVIVCRSDGEVEQLEKALTKAKYTVFACNTTMTVQDLYNLSVSWNEYEESLSSPIMVCCDDNLSHMNITDAHYLVHYSLPNLFSKFCKRFSVLNENYGSIFKEDNESVKIKMLLEEENTDQLPKILHFIKRCTNDVPEALEKICATVLSKKELMKAEKLVPICDNLLGFGECPDFWNCQERHVLSKKSDEPKSWVPTNGVITFKIIHYHSAVLYSARLITHVKGGETKKFPQNYNMLSMKLSMHFSVESNRKLHGIPKVGDISAVCVRQNFFLRCQVVKILNHYHNGRPNYVLVRLIDEERLESTRDIYLYHLPDEMRNPETFVVQVRLASIQPKDKDITFSGLAMERLQMITDTDPDLYLRGHITLIIGNCIFLDKLETCKDLSTTDRTIIRHDFRQELASHAIDNPKHLPKLKKICNDSNLEIIHEQEITEVAKPVKKVFKPQWAHLENDDLSLVYFASALDPGTFFVRLVKFEDSCNRLIREIEKYTELNPNSVADVTVGDIVLAKFPGASFERARIDEVTKNRVKCFFVDQGDWMDVLVQDLMPIPEKFVTQLPFQAIECRLYGVKPVGDQWTEFSTTWLSNKFEDDSGDLKQLYVQYLAKERAFNTEGNKYAIVILDTTTEQELNINKMLVDVNLADPNNDEWKKIDYLISKTTIKPNSTESQDENGVSDDEKSWENVRTNSTTPEIVSAPRIPFDELFPKKPLRSINLQPDYSTDNLEEKWQINDIEDFIGMLKPAGQNMYESPKENIPAIENASQRSSTETETVEPKIVTQIVDDDSTDASSSILKKIKQSKIITDTNDFTDTGSKLQIISNGFHIVSTDAKALDSDDLTTPDTEGSVASAEETAEISVKEQKNITEVELRTPKLCWCQNNKCVSIKILLIGVEKYDLQIEERGLKFEAITNGLKYAFDIELYGVIDTRQSSHENKGQYILIKLEKILNRIWLTLTRNGIQKWIVYDVDSINTSSDEEEEKVTDDIVRNFCKLDSESEEESFVDDVNFSYKR